MVCLRRVADTRDYRESNWTENARTCAGNHTEITPGALEGVGDW
jgi:hypothetical protein